MEGVESVRQIDDTHLEWTAQVAGVRKHWKAEITEQTPDQRIAWQATDGAQNAGVVTFHRLDDRKIAGDPAARRRARGRDRVGRRCPRVRPAPGQGRPRSVQGVRRGAWRRDRGVARHGRPARRQRLIRSMIGRAGAAPGFPARSLQAITGRKPTDRDVGGARLEAVAPVPLGVRGPRFSVQTRPSVQLPSHGSPTAPADQCRCVRRGRPTTRRERQAR